MYVVHAAPPVIDEYLMLALQRCQITHLTGFDGNEQFILRCSGCAQQNRAEGVSRLATVPHRMLVTIAGNEPPMPSCLP